MSDVEDAELVGALRDDDNDIDRIDPVPDTITLACGIEVHVLPLRTRQLFKLLRIITHGAGQTLMNSGLDFSEAAPVFIQKLLGVVLFSIPDAEQEAIDFIQVMMEPAGLVDKAASALSKQERELNIDLWTKLNMELWNPDPSDLIDIIENIVRREGDDLQALGKKLRGFMELAQKTGQLKDESGSGKPLQDLNLPENSPASSTSSAPSTAGATSGSSTSPSAASGSSSRRSPRASGKRSAPAAV